MRTTALAAFAALVAVAPMAVAQTTGSSQPVADDSVRATAEARAIVSTMQGNARVAREALELARKRHQREEIRCADEALSRADVALRWGRTDADQLAESLVVHDAPSTLLSLQRLRFRGIDSRDAATMASRCSAPDRLLDRTSVTVHMDGSLPPPSLTF